MLAALLAAPFVPSVLLNGPDVFRTADIPYWLRRDRVTKIVRSRVYIRPDGHVERCVVENPVRDNRLGNLTCELFQRRARFRGARWMDETPVWGVYRVPIQWGFDTRAIPYGDVELRVAKLPREFGSSITLNLILAIDETGAIVRCQSMVPGPSKGQLSAGKTLTPPACTAIRTSGWKPVPPTEFTGKPQRSVQSASVRFSTQ